MSGPDEADLAAFLKNIRNGEEPLRSLRCGRANAVFNPAACDSSQAGELARIANRPLPGLTLYKFGSRSIVGSYTLADGLPVVLKYYYPSGPHKHLSYGIRGSRCYQSWVAGLAMNYMGIPTPAPLLIAEWQLLGGLWLSKSFLCTRQAPGISLRDFVGSHPEDEAALSTVAVNLRQAFSRMNRYRVAHGDLKATNIIIDPSNGHSISLIDLDAAEVLMSPDRWNRASAKDRRRFSKNWQPLSTAARIFKNAFDPLDVPFP